MTDEASGQARQDAVAEAATPTTSESSNTGRRVLSAVFWLLASLTVLFGGTTLWAHQTLLTADGWGGLVEEVIAEPEVIDAVSVVIVDRLSDSLAVKEVVADVIQGPDIVAGALAGVVENKVVDAVAAFGATDAFQEAFVNVNKATHEAALKVMRGGDSEALTSEEGLITLNVFPLIEGVLISLQDAGFIDEGREIPDLTGYEPSPRAISLLETVLGRDLPDGIGTIVLVDSENLDLIQTVVRWFDLITIVMLLLWVVFTAMALWLSSRRIRMVLWLSGGAIAALMTARVFARLILAGITRQQEEADARVVVDAIIDAAVDSLMWFTFILIAVAVIVAIAAVAWEHSRTGERPSEETPPRTLGHWVRDNMMAIFAVGIAIIAIMALWSIGGPDIALLTAAALGLLAIAVKVLADHDGGGGGGEAEAIPTESSEG